MPTRSLTVAGVARVKPPRQGQVDYFDKGFPGLALRVSYGGAKVWAYFYRLHGKLRRMSLGRFPAMSLNEAREAWRAARLAVSKGESPTHVKPTTADTFAAVAEEWLRRDQAQNRSVAEVRRVIERDVRPVWGERLIAGITRRDALELIDAVGDRGAITMARRLSTDTQILVRDRRLRRAGTAESRRSRALWPYRFEIYRRFFAHQAAVGAEITLSAAAADLR
jgi:hypothetical protein